MRSMVVGSGSERPFASVDDIKRAVKEELLKPRWRACDVASITELVLRDKGLASQLSNKIYAQCRAGTDRQPRQAWGDMAPAASLGASAAQRSRPAAGPSTARTASSPLPPPPLATSTAYGQVDELAAVAALREKWLHTLGTWVQRLAEESGAPLMNSRNEAEAELSLAQSRAQRMRMKGLYTAEDLLDAIASFRHPNQTASVTAIRGWALVPFSFATPSLRECAERFTALQLSARQGGLDDLRRGWYSHGPIRTREVASPERAPSVARVSRSPKRPPSCGRYSEERQRMCEKASAGR